MTTIALYVGAALGYGIAVPWLIAVVVYNVRVNRINAALRRQWGPR